MNAVLELGWLLYAFAGRWAKTGGRPKEQLLHVSRTDR